MSSQSGLVLYPGSFDPFTLGHEDIVLRASRMFERVEIAIGVHESKQSLLSVEERRRAIEEVVGHLGNVSVSTFEGLVAAYARSQGAFALLRGLRQADDFAYEARMAHANHKIGDGLETIYLSASATYMYLSSTIVRDVYRWGGDVTAFVPGPVARALREHAPRT